VAQTLMGAVFGSNIWNSITYLIVHFFVTML
jgi:Ca2+/Na+ antiporter